MRDDNSLIKGIVRSFNVQSKKIHSYNGLKLGNGFVASHIWGKVKINEKEMLSSRHYMLNTFVPNIVWLPVQISKLTDREGSIAQKILKAISLGIYRNIGTPQEISDLWNNLDIEQSFFENSVVEERINSFIIPSGWLGKRIEQLLSEVETILSIDSIDINGVPKVKSSRYLPTLKEISKEQRNELNNWLHKYQIILKRSLSELTS